jgi:hypothetical protein
MPAVRSQRLAAMPPVFQDLNGLSAGHERFITDLANPVSQLITGTSGMARILPTTKDMNVIPTAGAWSDALALAAALRDAIRATGDFRSSGYIANQCPEVEILGSMVSPDPESLPQYYSQ